MTKDWGLLLLSILRARHRGLLRIRKTQSNTLFQCLKDKCPRSCCWVFDMIQLEPNELTSIQSNKIKIGKVHYLTQKEYPCPTGKACFEYSNGFCEIYSARPKSCQEYPWYRYNDLLYFDSLCPGITDEPSGSKPQVFELLDSGRYFSHLPILIRKPLLWLITHI